MNVPNIPNIPNIPNYSKEEYTHVLQMVSISLANQGRKYALADLFAERMICCLDSYRQGILVLSDVLAENDLGESVHMYTELECRPASPEEQEIVVADLIKLLTAYNAASK